MERGKKGKKGEKGRDELACKEGPVDEVEGVFLAAAIHGFFLPAAVRVYAGRSAQVGRRLPSGSDRFSRF